MSLSQLRTDLSTTVRGLPKYALGYAGGLVVLSLSEPEITNIAALGLAASIYTKSPTLGATAFFAGYTFAKSVGTLGDALVHATQMRNSGEQNTFGPTLSAAIQAFNSQDPKSGIVYERGTQPQGWSKGPPQR